MSNDDLRFTPTRVAPVIRRQVPDRGPSREITHILLWWSDERLRWHVAAGDERGELRGKTEDYFSREDADRAAGRLAKQTGAGELIVWNGEKIEKFDYWRSV